MRSKLLSIAAVAAQFNRHVRPSLRPPRQLRRLTTTASARRSSTHPHRGQLEVGWQIRVSIYLDAPVPAGLVTFRRRVSPPAPPLAIVEESGWRRERRKGEEWLVQGDKVFGSVE